jgi:DNA-binding PadR family transcriptional regulator
MPRVPRPSSAGLTVLSLLSAAPLHPYGMQRLIKAWGKDKVVNVGQRANLYKTIKRLQDAGLIAVRQTERSGQYPERTVYELTHEGRATGRRWLADMLRTPRNEFPEFPAALSFAMGLTPDELSEVLAERLNAVQAQLAQLNDVLRTAQPMLPRITLLETEYQHAITNAEAHWISSIVDDLNSGKLSWQHEQLLHQAAESLSQAVTP